MSSDDSDNEEKKAALADALQCDFVQQAFNGKFTGETKGTNFYVTKDEEKTRSNFEDTIAEILTKRLDQKFKETKVENNERKINSENGEEKKHGIQLFQKGPVVTSDDLLLAQHNKEGSEFNKNKVKKSKKTQLNDELYNERAAESAVTSEWVCSKFNTKYWSNIYNWRLIKMKKLKSVNNKGAIVCQVLKDDI